MAATTHLKDLFFYSLTAAFVLWGQAEVSVANLQLSGAVAQPLPCAPGSAVDSNPATITNLCGALEADRRNLDVATIAVGSLVCIYGAFIFVQCGQAFMKSSGWVKEQVGMPEPTRVACLAGLSCLSVFFLVGHARIGNQLVALGAVEASGPPPVPDWGSLLALRAPGIGRGEDLARSVRELAAFCRAALCRNVFVALLLLLREDLHVVSLMLASVPAAMLVLMCWVPSSAALQVFESVDAVFAGRGHFEMGSEQRLALVGAFLAAAGIVAACLSIYLPALQCAAADLRGMLQVRPEVGASAGLWRYLRNFLLYLGTFSIPGTALQMASGVTGIALLSFAANNAQAEHALLSLNKDADLPGVWDPLSVVVCCHGVCVLTQLACVLHACSCCGVDEDFLDSLRLSKACPTWLACCVRRIFEAGEEDPSHHGTEVVQV